jgi:hypothetical protein
MAERQHADPIVDHAACRSDTDHMDQKPLAPRGGAPRSAADVMALQRLAGNRAVAALVGRARSVQRMNLGQTGWKPTLADIGGRSIVSDPGRRSGHVYEETVAAAPDKLGALQAAGAANANVGTTVDDGAETNWRYTNLNDKWTRKHERLNDGTLNAIDPFFYSVKVPFTYGGGKHELNLYFQHAPRWTGYVESLLDTSNPATQGAPSMYDFSSEGRLKNRPFGQGPAFRNPQYSNIHEASSTTGTFGQTAGGTEHSFDAYTKIAGEGARWKCVRNHASGLANDSLFFVWDTGGAVNGVSFESLWLSWASVFGKRYDIDDATVASAIRGNATFKGDGIVSGAPRLGKDYDLDKGRTHFNVAPAARAAAEGASIPATGVPVSAGKATASVTGASLPATGVPVLTGPATASVGPEGASIPATGVPVSAGKATAPIGAEAASIPATGVPVGPTTASVTEGSSIPATGVPPLSPKTTASSVMETVTKESEEAAETGGETTGGTTDKGGGAGTGGDEGGLEITEADVKVIEAVSPSKTTAAETEPESDTGGRTGGGAGTGAPTKLTKNQRRKLRLRQAKAKVET